MQEYVLMRTGNTPLKFSGKQLGEARGWIYNNQGPSWWHKLIVYKTVGGEYVVEDVSHTLWEEDVHFDATVLSNIDDIVDYLHSLDHLERCSPNVLEALEQIPEATERID